VNRSLLAALLAFNGGFVDTAGFLGLQGLFVAHVTGSFARSQRHWCSTRRV